MNDEPMIEREALTFGATAMASLKDCSDSSTIILFLTAAGAGGSSSKEKEHLGPLF